MLNEKDKYQLFAEHFTYDKDTGQFTRKSDNSLMQANDKGYVRLSCKGHRMQAHRLAWYIIHEEPPKNIVDHINRVRDDNRGDNLREACNQRNSRNTSKMSGGEAGRDFTSKYKGVRRLSTYYSSGNLRRNPWQARIKLDKQKSCISLGCYATEEEAAKAYDAGAKEHYGEFAALNFPED